MQRKTIRDVDFDGKKVIMRVDFNVPLEDGELRDNARIRAVIPSIKEILSKGATLILMSHLGRPKGKVVKSLSLKPVAKELSLLLGKEVKMAGDCVGDEVKKSVASLNKGELLLLENLRFHKEEELNDKGFAKELALLADIYVNDAFGIAHREHASNVGITNYLPSVFGFLIEKELKYLLLLNKAEKPFIAIIGGSKVSSKIGVLESLISKVDSLIIGGGMTYTFARADGWLTGDSLVEKDHIETAKNIIKKAKANRVELVIPVDHVVADKMSKDAITKTVTGDIPDGFIGVDIGRSTISLIKLKLQNAKTALWNGPLGVFEIEPFSKGTFEVARSLSLMSGVSIVGGGDSAAAINKIKLQDKISHVSTGGGAAITLIAGKTLPSIAAIDKQTIC